MRRIYLIVYLFIYSILNIGAQNSVKLFTGLNYSNTSYHLINNLQMSDSFGLRKGYYLLPSLGMDINFNLSNKLEFTTGFGISIMGSRKYTDPIPDNSSLEPHLKLNYLRFPLIFSYNLNKNYKLFSGYTLNYCFRKNYNFYASNASVNGQLNIFNSIHHGWVFGLSFRTSNYDFTLSYHSGLNRIWDTEQFFPDQRAYLNLFAFQLTAGYLIHE